MFEMSESESQSIREGISASHNKKQAARIKALEAKLEEAEEEVRGVYEESTKIMTANDKQITELEGKLRYANELVDWEDEKAHEFCDYFYADLQAKLSSAEHKRKMWEKSSRDGAAEFVVLETKLSEAEAEIGRLKNE